MGFDEAGDVAEILEALALAGFLGGPKMPLAKAGEGVVGFARFCTRQLPGARTRNPRVTMRKDIHPKYDEATISCACGHVLKTRSTDKSMSINTCAACHPYFTGQAKFIDTEGRVDRFNKRYAKKATSKK